MIVTFDAGILVRATDSSSGPARRVLDAVVNSPLHVAALSDLDSRIREAVLTVPEANRKLLTYHDSWAYWAREYGFTVIGAVQASDFSDPSPRDVAALIDQIKAEHVPAVFGSEVFPSPILEQIARESGATFVDALRDDEPPAAERTSDPWRWADERSQRNIISAPPSQTAR